jgi:ABC-type Mn2+/Zn2+ transport system ATPase subunit
MSALAEAQVGVQRIQSFLQLDELPTRHRSAFDPSLPYSISVRHASFLWSPEQKIPTLSDVSLLIKPGQLVGIIGLVGSGKSSLLAALLGEMILINAADPKLPISPEDDVHINGQVAYVSQEAWINNDTVRGNILFGSEYEPELYQTVLEAACLIHDLSILPNGDLTEIGERGINLSGGQKSRVSIARALYRHRKCDIYAMDDPFAAVDMSVGAHIFQRAVGGQGLLKGKTRIVVLSSHLHLLEQFDHIVVLESAHEAAAATAAANAAASDAKATSLASPSLVDAAVSRDTIPACASASPGVSPSGAPDIPDNKSLEEQPDGGRIIAMGTFTELKGRFGSLMSQLYRADSLMLEQEPKDQLAEEQKLDRQVSDPTRTPSHSVHIMKVPADTPASHTRATSAFPAPTLSVDPTAMRSPKSRGLSLEIPQRQRTWSNAGTPPAAGTPRATPRATPHGSPRTPGGRRLGAVKRLSRAQSSFSHSRKESFASSLAKEAELQAKQAAAAKQAALIKAAPKSLIEKEEREQGAVGLQIWIQYFARGGSQWLGAFWLVSSFLDTSHSCSVCLTL